MARRPVTIVEDHAAEIAVLERAWHGANPENHPSTTRGNRAQLTITRNSSNAMPTAGWLMMIFLHVTALTVRLEREEGA